MQTKRDQASTRYVQTIPHHTVSINSVFAVVVISITVLYLIGLAIQAMRSGGAEVDSAYDSSYYKVDDTESHPNT